MKHYILLLLILTPTYGFFLGKKSTKRPPGGHQVYTGTPVYTSVNTQLNEVDSYGSPSAPIITTYEPENDSYGSPAAPVVSYQEPQSYSAPVKVKKSVPGGAAQVQNEEIDGYGAPLAPVVSASVPTLSYSEPPAIPQYKRPKRHKKVKQMNPLYMPVMSLLSLMPSYKPKRHIRMPLIRMPMFRMPRFRMPTIKHKRPTKIMPTFTTLKNTKTYPMKTFKPEVHRGPKMEYSGWKPIGHSEYSPIPPEYPQPEPEIITIDNAHRHPKKYTPVEIVDTGYAPEPITATPAYEDNTIYGAPATYEIGHSAEIEPLFDSAPVQDLTSLAAVEEHHTETLQQYGGYSQVSPGYYQSTLAPETLAQDVHSSAIYVQQPEQDLYYQPSPAYQQGFYQSSPNPGSTAQASYNIHVNGQTHGFSHNFDHS